MAKGIAKGGIGLQYALGKLSLGKDRLNDVRYFSDYTTGIIANRRPAIFHCRQRTFPDVGHPFSEL